MGKVILILALAIQVLSQVEPPVWPSHFSQSFVESYGFAPMHVSGKYYYDSEKGYTRIDRLDGKFDLVCASITPNVTTPCNTLIRDGKRYIIFPERRSCCMCCDAAHGCGILKPDWLSTAKYEGEETLLGESFNKWSIQRMQSDIQMAL